MAASNDNKRRKKSIATYGKAVRRRGPDYLDPTKAFEDELIDGGKRQSSVSHNKEAALDPASCAQYSQLSPAPISDGADVFDFPSSHTEDNNSHPQKRKKPTREPQAPLKRAKKDYIATAAAPTDMSNGNRSAQAKSRNIADNRRAAKSGRVQVHNLKSNGDKISPLIESISPSSTIIGTKHGLTDCIQARSRTIVGIKSSTTTPSERDSCQEAQEHVSFSTDDNNSLVAPPQTTLQPAPSKPRSSTSNLGCPRTSTPCRDDTEISPTFGDHSTPTAHTAKSVKIRNGLSGVDFETSSHATAKDIANQVTPRSRRAPRKRLIDALIEQVAERPSSRKNSDSENDDSSSKQETPRVQPARYTNIADESEKIAHVVPVGVVSSIPQAPGPKITYSRQRSMLEEQDLLVSIDPGSSQYDNERADTWRKRRGSIPTLSQARSQAENDDVDDKQPGGGIRTVHELRQAGANKRFMDEVEDLSERIGIPSKQSSMRRSGLLDLLGKMHDKAFLRNLVSSGMDQRLFLRLGDEVDIIAGFIIASVLVILLRSTASPVATSYLLCQDFSNFISRLIKVGDTITVFARQRKTNMSKAAQTLLAEEHSRLLEMQIWGEVQPKMLSPRTVALACLDLVVRQNRVSGGAGEIISDGMRDDLFMILEPYSKEDSWQRIETLQLADLHLTLSVFEFCSLGFASDTAESGWAEEHLAIVREVVSGLFRTAPNEFTSTRALLLRLTLNITNNNSQASDIFATPGFIRDIFSDIISAFKLLPILSSEKERLISVDSLILTLGVMINVVEWSVRAKEHAHVLDDISLEDALQIFMENVEKTSEVCNELYLAYSQLC